MSLNTLESIFINAFKDEQKQDGSLTCLCFGSMSQRKLNFPEAKFCNECEQYEEVCMLNLTRLKKRTKRQQCKAVHKSQTEPELKTTYCPSKSPQKKKVKEEAIEKEQSDLNSLKKQIEILQDKNFEIVTKGTAKVKAKITELHKKYKSGAGKRKTTIHNTEANKLPKLCFDDMVSTALLKTKKEGHNNRMNNNLFAEQLVNTLWNCNDICDGGEIKNAMRKIVAKDMKETVFHPYEWAKVIDQTGGALSLNAFKKVKVGLEKNCDISQVIQVIV